LVLVYGIGHEPTASKMRPANILVIYLYTDILILHNEF